MVESLALTSLTGNLDGYLVMQAIGSLITVSAFAYIMIKIVLMFLSLAAATEKYDVEKYKNKTYLDTVYTAYKIGLVRKAATAEGFELNTEIGNIPVTDSKNIAEILKTQVEREISK